jgi:hypothetical protein
MNSEEVIDALVSSPEPVEMDSGDVRKVSLPGRFGVEIAVADPDRVAESVLAARSSDSRKAPVPGSSSTANGDATARS